MPRIAEPDTAESAPSLACLVAGPDGEHVARVTELLERSARVGRVERAASEVVLRHALAVQHRDLVVVVLDAPDRLLPSSLLRYPGTRVLVIAPDGVHGTLSRWLQQGANDLVSPHDEDALAHALGRLVDECALAAQVRRLEGVVTAQRRRIETLMSRLDDAGRAAAPPARAPAGTPQRRAGDAAARAADGTRAEAPDPASRLPGRAATLAALEALAREPGAPSRRLTALQVVFPAGSVHDRLDTTLGDLTACRAADVLRRFLPGALLLGRTRRDTLLAVCEGDREGFGGQDPAARLAARLGSLGGLVERAGDLRVDALGGPASVIATASVAERLERRAQRALTAERALGAPEPDPAHGADATGTGATGARSRGGRVARAAGRAEAAEPAETRYIGESASEGVGERTLDESLVPILTQRSASARFERPTVGA